MSNKLPHIMAQLEVYKLFASAEPDPVVDHILKSYGVDVGLVTNLAGPIVRVLVSFSLDGSFEYDDIGEVAFAMAVHANDGVTVTDLVAWSARDPATFGTMFGTGVLGLEVLTNPASYVTHPCPLYSAPMSWLQAGCNGAAVLNYEAARSPLEAAPGLLAPDTLEFANSLVINGIVRPHKLMVLTAKGVAA
jgi:hypothetical protein